MRAEPEGSEEWGAVLDANVYIWRFVANYLPGQVDKDVCAELGETLRNHRRFHAYGLPQAS